MEITRRYSLYALGIIFLANFLNYLDRQLVSALEKPVTGALQLTGTEFGLLWTLFTVGYIASAPFVGFLTDRYRRPTVFAVCIVIWSAATMSSGMAQTKMVLYVSRFFIGVGEAGCLIIGPSLISEYFSRKVRGRALSAFYLGLPLGGTAGYVLGGVFEKMEAWRSAFWVAGIPGIAVAVFIFLLKEPPRGAVEGASETQKMRGFRPYFDLLKTRTLMYIIFAEAFAVMILVPLLHFGKAFFQEARGLDPLQASLTLGIIALTAGVLGNLTSGWLGDRLNKRLPGAYALIAGISYLVGMPFIIASFFVGPHWLFMALLMAGCFFYFMCMPAVNTQIANVTHPNQRAMAYALAVFTLHFLGDMMTPPIFGTVSDSLTRKSDPVTVNRVRVTFPTGSLPLQFGLQYKSYDPHQDAGHGEEGQERWADVRVRSVRNAKAIGEAYAATDRVAEFEIEPVATTRMRYVHRLGPMTHPAQARVVELEVFDGENAWKPVRAEASSGKEVAFKLVDGDATDASVWASEGTNKRHSASSIFGHPGKGRRAAFILFSIAMVVSGIVCFLAYRHAGRDAARIVESLTQLRMKPPEGLPPPKA
jgi:MFS family permease